MEADGEGAEVPAFDLHEEQQEPVVQSVGTGTPVPDFLALLAAGRQEEAFAGLRAAILKIAQESLGDM